MVAYMEKKGYAFEAEYIRVIVNWRRACDERGLSQLQRCHYNHQLLQYLIDDLMAWHLQQYDLSLLEVNRYYNCIAIVEEVCAVIFLLKYVLLAVVRDLHGVRGLTRETLIALTTNIESREWRRREIVNAETPHEHPRASTTDDVECFFSVLQDMVGKHFTVREAQYGWRKACIEFGKRLDPELPFFYHTSSHDRFYEGSRPDFDKVDDVHTSKRNPKQQRIRRREQPGHLAAGRATYAVPGARSTRAMFHNVPLELPPPPMSAQQHMPEHSYV